MSGGMVWDGRVGATVGREIIEIGVDVAARTRVDFGGCFGGTTRVAEAAEDVEVAVCWGDDAGVWEIECTW